MVFKTIHSFLRKKILPPKEPERSPVLRLIILAAMLIPLVALARVGPLWPYTMAAAIGISLGHGYSYRSLARPSQLLRAVMFVGIHIAMLWLLIGLGVGAALPQAQFAIFTQAITSFDLRYRSSLFNTLIHSLANLYIAASLSRTSELAIYLVLFAGLVLAAFFVAEKEDGIKSARLQPTIGLVRTAPGYSRSIQRYGLVIFGVSFGAMALFFIGVVFLFTPRFASRPIVPPFTINTPLRGGVKSEIINPGIPVVQINGWSDDTSDYYYGFDTDLDLRYRGGLSDEVVMYVRSPSRSYWRSHSYDFYTGVSWNQSDKTLTDVKNRRGVYYEFPSPLGSDLNEKTRDPHRSPRHVEELFGQAETPVNEDQSLQQIVQSFTVVREQPNLIFAAYRPTEIFIITEHLSVDSGDGIRLPEPLYPGLTYSVVSYRPEFEPELLRQAPVNYPPAIIQRYLQLPGTISGRVKNLAQTLATPYNNNYDRIMALNAYLLTYPYNFFPPPHPPGAEVVDTFLFEDRQGVCEQYVTALVVMARSLGIPARLAAGYGSGTYNNLTGYYEVRLSDAHSWAEVYFPEYGWVPFDPTPGWIPQPYPTPVQTWFFSYGGKFPALTLPAADLIAGGATHLAKAGPFLLGVGVLAGAVVLVIFLRRYLVLPSWKLSPRQRYTTVGNSPNRQIILALYQRGVRLLIRKKYRRREVSETLSEYAWSVGNVPALLDLTRTAEIAAYRPEAPAKDVVAEAEAALTILTRELEAKSKH